MRFEVSSQKNNSGIDHLPRAHDNNVLTVLYMYTQSLLFLIENLFCHRGRFILECRNSICWGLTSKKYGSTTLCPLVGVWAGEVLFKSVAFHLSFPTLASFHLSHLDLEAIPYDFTSLRRQRNDLIAHRCHALGRGWVLVLVSYSSVCRPVLGCGKVKGELRPSTCPILVV